MDIRKGGFAIICCLTMVLSCQEEILLCPRPNMTCATAVCDCYVYFSNINRVFCTRVNLTDIPSEIPSTITYIEMNGNNITTIKNGSFRELPYLEKLFLSNNNIQNIEPGAFSDMSSLTTIDLYDNDIIILVAGIFRNLRVLQKIYIGSNKITTLVDGTFKDLPNLREINFNGNPITLIESYAFFDLHKLDTIRLKISTIERLEEFSFVNIGPVLLIDISYNKLSVIAKNTFVSTRVGNLVLSSNSIHTIEEKAFVNSSVNDLVLSSNSIHIIKEKAFVNSSVNNLVLRDNAILTIEDNAFVNVSISNLYLRNNRLTRINKHMFTNISSLNYIDLKYNQISVIEGYGFYNLLQLTSFSVTGNPIQVVETYAFYNLPKLKIIDLSNCQIESVETEAFVHLSVLQKIDLNQNKLSRLTTNTFKDLPVDEIILTGNMIKEIEMDAFVNVKGHSLKLEIAEGFVMRDSGYRNFTFNNIYFLGNMVDCNCSFMWFALWLQDQDLNTTTVHGDCKNLNRTISELTTDDVMDCNEQLSYVCNVSFPVEIVCSSEFVKSDFSQLIHSRNGKIIRSLLTPFWSIPFCSVEDAGEYICVRRTYYSALPEYNSTTSLSVNGPPIVLDQQTYEFGGDLVLSIVFYIYPFTNEPIWFLQGNTILPGARYKIETGTIPVTLNQYQTNVTVEGFRTNLTIYNHKTLPYAVYICKIFNGFGAVEEAVVSRAANVVIPRNVHCNVTFGVEIKCTLDFIGAIPHLWIHSVGGQFIRSLQGTVYNNTNILEIPFCNHQDIGDYTCTWETDIPNSSYINKTTTLSVNGPPIILSHSLLVDGKDTVLSVVFFSYPFPKAPEWYVDNKPVGTTSHLLQSTTYSSVQMRQYRATVERMGFISKLTIINSEYSGHFHVIVKNNFGIAQQDMDLNKDNIDEDKQGSDSTILVGSVSASVIAVVILIVASVVVWRRKRKQKNESYTETVGQTCQRRDEDCYDTIGMSHVNNSQPDDYITLE